MPDEAADIAIRVAQTALDLSCISVLSYAEVHKALMAACGFVPLVDEIKCPSCGETIRARMSDSG